MLSRLLYRRPSVETALSALDKQRLKLPVLRLDALFDAFDQTPVTLHELPMGPWSSPLADVVALSKIAACLKPRRVLEVGAYRGYTTLMLARHTPEETRIVAFDMDPRHGEAYRGTPFEVRIERRIGEMAPGAFANDAPGSYDLIFLDADHTYEAVKRDTEILLPLLAPGGILTWHDYANWGRFSGKNGVPEYLAELARERSVAAVAGSSLAAYSPAWEGPQKEQFEAACAAAEPARAGGDPWSVGAVRG